MDITEVRDQELSTLLSDFMICTSCEFVDRDHKRQRVGYQCPRCRVVGTGAELYFPVSVSTLIDLMQEFYHLKQEKDVDSARISKIQNESNHRLAVVIFFCALVEVLLQHFLERRMSRMGLSHEVQEKLLKDNISAKRRFQELFLTLIGAKWKKIVKMLTKQAELNYIEAIDLYELAAKKRNLFLHEGNKWAIPEDMPEKCLRHISPVLNLFVALHNEYIAKQKGQLG